MKNIKAFSGKKSQENGQVGRKKQTKTRQKEQQEKAEEQKRWVGRGWQQAWGQNCRVGQGWGDGIREGGKLGGGLELYCGRNPVAELKKTKIDIMIILPFSGS